MSMPRITTCEHCGSPPTLGLVHEGTPFKFPVMESPTEYTAQVVRDLLWALIRNKRTPLAAYRFETQTELAAAIGVSLPFLSDVLHGKREPSGKVLAFLDLERVVTYRRTSLETKSGESK